MAESTVSHNVQEYHVLVKRSLFLGKIIGFQELKLINGFGFFPEDFVAKPKFMIFGQSEFHHSEGAVD